jgi:hypothetical protein
LCVVTTTLTGHDVMRDPTPADGVERAGGGRVISVSGDRYAWSFLDAGSVVRNGRAASSGS